MKFRQGTTHYHRESPLRRAYIHSCKHRRYRVPTLNHVVPASDNPRCDFLQTYVEREELILNAKWLNQCYTTRRKSRRNAIFRVLDTAAFAQAMQPRRHLPRSTFTGRRWEDYRSLSDLVGGMK